MTALSRLAEAMGVLRGYHDFGGAWRETGPETDRALLGAMGVSAGDEAEAAAALARIEAARAARLVPEEVILEACAPASIGFARAGDWTLTPEGETAPCATGAGDRADLPPLPPGVHRLTVGDQTTHVIAAPPQAPSFHDLTGRRRGWGVTGALYALDSRRNAGLGDYRDLGDMAEALGRHGAAFFGVNPVHAPGAVTPAGLISPYSPGHRGFLNPWHIALDDLTRFCGAEIAAPFAPPSGELIDYAAAAATREPALDAAFAAFEALPETSDIHRAFAGFVAEGGAPLADFARFEALSLRHGDDWRAWPAAFADPRGGAVAAFARDEAREIRRHLWRQWVADGQLAEAQRRARGAMGLGLYLDIAVGPRPGGAEVWADRASYARGVSLGAPPDHYSDAGQFWGLAPLSPPALAADGYRAFRALAAATMRRAGMARIDHVLGLNRAFWLPESGAPGGYVRYPFEALLAIARIEAARHGALLVGEDLGLVPEGFRDRLAEAGVYGVEVIQFTVGDDGHAPPPEAARARAVAAFSTHDAPTVAGYFAGHDLDWRVRLGELSPERRAQEAGRRDALAARLGGEDRAARRRAAHRLLAASAAELAAAQLDDIADTVEQQNLPGTVDEHPNWRRRHALTVEAAATDPALAETAAMMQEAGRGPEAEEQS